MRKLIIVISIAILLVGCGSAKKDPIYETKTNGGLTAKVYHGIETSDAALVMTAIEQYSNHECEKIDCETSDRIEYSDGAVSIVFNGATIDGQENRSGEIIYKDENGKKIPLYLSISGKEIISGNIADYDF